MTLAAAMSSARQRQPIPANASQLARAGKAISTILAGIRRTDHEMTAVLNR
jgi:hypothetical protein